MPLYSTVCPLPVNRKIFRHRISAPPPVNPTILLHMDGPNTSTTFTDNSLNNYSVTALGSAQISTDQYKFGGASGYFSPGSYIQSYLSETDWDQDFTVEMWIYYILQSEGGVYTIFEAGNIGDDRGGVHVYINGTNNIVFNNGISAAIESINTISNETWTHIAITRQSGTNYLFVGGNTEGTSDQTFPVENGTISIAAANIYEFYYGGYIDEFRIVKGYAAYTGNFTPPTSPFPNP